MSEQERFISLNPPTPSDAGQRFLTFLREELAERERDEALLAVYATQDGNTIRIWTFFAGEELVEGGPELESVHDAEVKIKAGYFTPTFGQPSFSIAVRALPAQGRTVIELEETYLPGQGEIVQIFPYPKAH